MLSTTTPFRKRRHANGARRRPRLGLIAAALAGVVALATGTLAGPVGSAQAAIAPAIDVAGPSPAILGIGNVAMSPDGTGGVVWLQLSQGVAHVFVSRFLNGQWTAPIQVDAGQTEPASFPQIAAGTGGELLVVWVMPLNSVSKAGGTPQTQYQLMSSVLGRGASQFGPAIEVDPENVGDGTGVDPSLAMAPNGNAYVAYRVVTNPLNPALPAVAGQLAPLRPGDEMIDVRVARFNGLSWSSLGVVNRLPDQVTMRAPNATNGPVVAVDREGDALVVWQEPTPDGYARIWARRLFGTRQGSPLLVSPETLDGQPVNVDADAPAVSLNDDGGAQVSFRLQAGTGGPPAQTEIFVNNLPSSQAPIAQQFDGPVVIGGGASVGAPSVSEDDFGHYQVAYTANASADMAAGGDGPLGAPQPLGPATGDAAVATVDPSGGGAAAWPSTGPNGEPVVDVHESLPDGGYQTGSLSAPISGPISSVSIGPSGDGDAVLAFEQGSGSSTQVAVADFQAPPQGFQDYTPNNWVAPKKARVTWDRPVNAIGPLVYSVLLDGHAVATDLHQRYDVPPPRGLGQGSYRVQVVATDTAGQQTVSSASELKVDDEPPLVSTDRMSDQRERFSVHDTASGAVPGATVITFGDGSRPVRGHLTVVHRYDHPGRYRVTVGCRDYAGNEAVHHLWVQVR